MRSKEATSTSANVQQKLKKIETNKDNVMVSDRESEISFSRSITRARQATVLLKASSLYEKKDVVVDWVD